MGGDACRVEVVPLLEDQPVRTHGEYGTGLERDGLPRRGNSAVRHLEGTVVHCLHADPHHHRVTKAVDGSPCTGQRWRRPADGRQLSSSSRTGRRESPPC